MRIKLDDNWSVESDTSSWNLHYEKEGEINPKTGKPMMTRNESYHARLVDALKCYLNEVPKSATTIGQVVAEWNKCAERVENACRGISKPQP